MLTIFLEIYIASYDTLAIAIGCITVRRSILSTAS